MLNCVHCKKKILLKMILALLEIKPTQIAAMLHLSNCVISRHFSGEKTCRDVDIFLIEKLFAIKIKDYSING